MQKLRKIFVKKDKEEVQIRLIELKRGDVFRMEPASENDKVNPGFWYVAVSDGYMNENQPTVNTEQVCSKCEHVITDEDDRSDTQCNACRAEKCL